VSIANDGTSALERAAEFKPDVVLLDIGLPDMSGYELAPRLRALATLPKEVFLVAITGYGAEHDRRRAGEAGFNRHMTKPVELDALKDLLASIPSASAKRARN
jgi:CheY-like chemotaxis protein